MTKVTRTTKQQQWQISISFLPFDVFKYWTKQLTSSNLDILSDVYLKTAEKLRKIKIRNKSDFQSAIKIPLKYVFIKYVMCKGYKMEGNFSAIGLSDDGFINLMSAFRQFIIKCLNVAGTISGCPFILRQICAKAD